MGIGQPLAKDSVVVRRRLDRGRGSFFKLLNTENLDLEIVFGFREFPEDSLGTE